MGSAIGLFCFPIFYFTLAVPFGKALNAGPFFWTSYAIWGVIGLLMSLRKSKNETRRTQNLFIALFFGLVGSSFLSYITFSPIFYLFTLAFPGFCDGIALSAVLILGKRFTTTNGERKIRHRKKESA